MSLSELYDRWLLGPSGVGALVRTSEISGLARELVCHRQRIFLQSVGNGSRREFGESFFAAPWNFTQVGIS